MQFRAPKNESGIDSKNFLKLKDKESTVGVFRGDPYDFRQHWVNNRSQLCTGEGCEYCAKKVKSGFRFRLNFVTKENNIPIAKIFEQGWGVYEQLRALHEGDYKLDKTIVRITRNGTGMETSYTVLPVPKFEVTPAIEAEISRVQLHDLQNPPQSNGEGPTGDNPPFPEDESIPF